jgi:aspartate/methionine/tyrosine aminotransferase
LTSDDVLVTAGAATALFIVNTALLRPDDHLIVAVPNYSTNIETPRAIGCQVDFLQLTLKEDFRVNLERLAALIRPQTRLISLTTPHNPTGTMLRVDELQAILQLVEARDCRLLLDETYRDLAFGPLPPLAASLSDRAISVSSMSKAFGLPGIRIGWLLTRDRRLMETFLAAKEQISICNSVVDEEIAYQFLRRKVEHFARIRRHVNRNREILEQWLAGESRLECVRPQGGVVCFPHIRPEVDVNRFYQTLNETHKTFVGPGHWFEMDRRFMRVGFGWPDAGQLTRGLDSISLSLDEVCPR